MEKANIPNLDVCPLSRNEGNTIYITEPGLYALIMRSNLPAARTFQNLVYNTIKTIRQTGTYTIPQAVPLLEYTGTNPMNLQTENDLHYLVNTFLSKNMLVD